MSSALVAALKSCSRNLQLQQGKRIHAYICETSSGSNLFVVNTLVDMYSKCHSLEDSIHVFINATHKDSVTWNAMIAGCVHCDDFGQSLQTFQQMISEGVGIDRITAIAILKACTSPALLQHCLKFHAFVMENDFLSTDQRVLNSIVDMYCKSGRIQNARNFFNTLTRKTVVCWNVMISGYAQCENFHETMTLFQEMHVCGTEPNSTTLIIVLNVCSSWIDLLLGKMIHLYITELLIEPNERINCALIDMYCKSGFFEDAHAVFSESPDKDVVTWSALIGGYVFHGLCIEAFYLFEQMEHDGIRPNDITYLSIIKACTKMISLDHGKKIHENIRGSKFEVATTVGNALMDMYIKCGSLADAYDVFDKLPHRSVITWSTLITGNVEHGFWVEAFQLFRSMQKEGLTASSITISYILKACSSTCAFLQGKLVHAYSIEISAESDVMVANTLVYMYIRCGCFEDACDIFHDSLDFDVVTWSAMIAGCKDHKQAIQFFTNMLHAGQKPNDVTFIALLSVCSQSGCVNESLRLFQSMMADYGIVASVEHYNCMIDLLARAGYLPEAKMMRSTMPFMPDVKVWTSLLSHSKVLGDVNLENFDTMAIVCDTSVCGYM